MSTSTTKSDTEVAHPKTLVFTATYNERDNIPLLLGRIFALDDHLEVLVVDDNSPDGTGLLLDEVAAGNSRLHVVHRPGKLGLGSAHQLAMLYAIQHGYDRLVTMDADMSHDPASIPDLLAALDAGNDFVIGSRYASGGSSDYDGYRMFVSVCANTLARTLLRIPLYEFTTSFRAFRVEKLRTRRCAKLKASGYSYFMETVYRLHRAGYRMAEVPIQFRDRHAGVSKIPRLEIFNGVSKLFRLALSSVFGSRDFQQAVDVHTRCAACGSSYLIEQFAAHGRHSAPAGSEAFRCSSLGHSSNPQVVTCLQCGLMHVPVEQQDKGLDQLYEDVEDPLYLENRKAREITFRETYERVAPYLPAPGKLLEIGSYCGLFLAEAKWRGWQIEGIEPSRWASEIARRETQALVHTGTFDSVRDQLLPPYQAVAAWDVIEHLRDPMAFLRDCNALLEDSGILCLSTIDAGSRFARLLGRRWPWLMDMHLYYFTRPLLRRWLMASGFEVLDTRDYRHYATLAYLAEKAGSLLPGPLGRIAARLAKILPTGWAVPISFGDVVLIVARKIRPC